MAELSTIARPYTDAAFAAAQGASADLNTWINPLNVLGQAVQDPKVQQILSSPTVDNDKRISVLTSFVDGELPKGFENFIRLLIENKRHAALPAIAEQFQILKNQQEGSARADIYSAFELSQEQIDKVVSDLQPKFDKKLKPVVTIDPSLIGGVRVVVGDHVLDTSVQAQLSRLYHKLVAE